MCALSCPCCSSLPLQEVLDLGDGASTDSGWGGSASSSNEEKRSGWEHDGGNDDDGERSTSSSSGGGRSIVKRDSSPVVAGSELAGPALAVFLFQGGVKGESDAALEAKDDHSGDPSAVARREAAQSPDLLPSAEDAFFEYSGFGGEASSGTAREVLRTGGLRSSSTVGKATTRESGDSAAMSGEDSAARSGVDFSERREAVVDRGDKSSSLTGELRGVDFVDMPL